MKYVFIFPGQGSQKVGMGKDLYEESSFGKEIFSTVDKALNRNLSEIIFNGPQEELNQTFNTQIAIASVSMALIKYLESEAKKNNIELNPIACCGHSLGEYTALWYGGIINTEDSIRLISKRGELMQTAPPGAMAAVLNLELEKIQSIITLPPFKDKVIIANYNTSSQYVLSGNKEVFNSLLTVIKSEGGKGILLPVSGAFHSPLMQNPSNIFSIEVENIKQLSDSKIPIYQNVDASPSSDRKIIIEKLKMQMTSPVYWTQTINNLVKSGITNFVEIGPGKVLTGLIKKINNATNCYNVSDIQSAKDLLLNNEHGLFLQQA